MNKTTIAQREEMYRQHLMGKSYAEIAEFNHLSKECVRYWCRKQRNGRAARPNIHREKFWTASTHW